MKKKKVINYKKTLGIVLFVYAFMVLTPLYFVSPVDPEINIPGSRYNI